MPRFVPLLLLLACRATPQAAAPPLLVGVAETDITPDRPYGMSGYYHERKSTEVRDRLHAKALVFLQGEERAALVECDLCGASPELTEQVRRRISKRSRIPAQNVIVAATHTHTGPEYADDLREWLKRGGGDPSAYPARLIDAVAEAVVRAEAAAAPLRLRTGTGRQETPVSFSRRFFMKDGSVRTWANYRNPETVREANPVDPEIGLLLADDPASGRARAGLVNFALHLDTLGGTRWSADFPHDLGESLREELGPGFLAIFANGCCGDINHIDPRAEKRNPTDAIGRSLASSVKAALPGLREIRPSVRVARSVIDAPLQEAPPADLEWARAVTARDRKGEKLPFLDEVRAYKLLHVERLRLRGASLPLEVHAIRLDEDAAIVTLPGEVFVELGLAIKKASPFRTTLVVELANTDETIYIPTRDAYPLGGYEVVNSALAPGGGERLVEEALNLLRRLK
jgi:hypothetical protein